jgi:hypothetical protein
MVTDLINADMGNTNGFLYGSIMSKVGGQQRSSAIHKFVDLKVLANEKRGGLKVVAFDRPPFKLFTLRFSYKSVQAPSCEKP